MGIVSEQADVALRLLGEVTASGVVSRNAWGKEEKTQENKNRE